MKERMSKSNVLPVFYAQMVKEQYKRAVAFHQAGQLPQAEKIYQEILRIDPNHSGVLYLLGLIHFQVGRLDAAVELMGKSILINGSDASARVNMGIALTALKKFNEALDQFDVALKLKPGMVEVYINRGIALHELKRYEDALLDFNAAELLKPNVAQIFINKGNLLRDMNRLSESIDAFNVAVGIDSGNAEIYYNKALTLQEMGDKLSALECYEQAIVCGVSHDRAYQNKSVVLKELGRNDDAKQSCQKALEINPGNADAYNTLGSLLHISREKEDALKAFRASIKLNDHHVEAFGNLATLLVEMKQWDEALAAYERVLELKSDSVSANVGLGDIYSFFKRTIVAENYYRSALDVDGESVPALSGLASVLSGLGKHSEAIECFEKIIDIEPENHYLFTKLLYARLKICVWDGFERDSQKFLGLVAAGGVVVDPLVCMTIADVPRLHLMANMAYCDSTGLSEFPDKPVLMSESGDRRKIRVAYFSGDFNSHPVGYLMAGIFENHDRDKYELIAFSMVNLPDDPMQQRIESAFDRFIDISKMSDSEVVAMAKELSVDIAIDLVGHTSYSRTSIFYERCAPVQINYLGFPGTIGSDCYDYIVADKNIIPEESVSYYKESAVRLPYSYMVYDNTRKISENVGSRMDWGLPEQGFVFCCFNNTVKILPDVFSTWMRVLKAVEGSVIWLPAAHDLVVENLKNTAKVSGVDPARLVFASRVPLIEDHLARYQLADLFLDTYPYNAHTTTADALYAGLPVLTRMGQSFASRVAGSLLNTSGLSDLVTNSPDEYEKKAIDLALSPNILSDIREKLWAERDINPLFRTAGHARYLEDAYDRMMSRVRIGLPPEGFDI